MLFCNAVCPIPVLATPFVFNCIAWLPIAVFSFPLLLTIELYPIATFEKPVVFWDKVKYPNAVFEFPVVLAFKLETPKAVFPNIEANPFPTLTPFTKISSENVFTPLNVWVLSNKAKVPLAFGKV